MSFLFYLQGKLLLQKTALLFKQLEEKGVFFRRAYADDPFRFSIPDQFPSLLMAAGGLPHQAITKYKNRKIWTIGIDLSHGINQSFSILALTLVNPFGELVGAWTKRQARDETTHADPLKFLLKCCKDKLNSYVDAGPIVIFRDGRMFENEDANLYRNILETDITILEFRKYGNPQINLIDRPWEFISFPVAAILPEEFTMFIILAPCKNADTLASVKKITWRQQWNGLKLNPDEISTIVTASAASPGLGLQPKHFPAPIYWADGIAKASPENLPFMGVPVKRFYD